MYSSNSALAAHVSSLDCFRASALTLDGTTANAGIQCIQCCIHVEPLWLQLTSTHYVQSMQMHVNASKSSQHSAWQWQPQAAFILLISFYKGVADTWQSGCNPRHVLPDKVMQIYNAMASWLAEADGSKRLVPCLQDTEIPEGFSCLRTLPGFSHRVPINVHPFRRNLRSYTKLQIKKWFSMHLTDLIEHKDRKDSNTSCSKLPNHKIWLGEGLPPNSKRSSTRTL